MDKSKLYDAREAGKFLGTTRQNVEQQRIKGHLKGAFYPNVGRGGKWMYHERDLLVYVWSDYYQGRDSFKHRQAQEKTNNDN